MRQCNKWAVRWTINDATDTHLENVLMVKNGKTRFRLKPIRDRHRVVCYRVDYAKGEMRSCWKGPVYLFPRGSTPPAKPKPGQHVPPMPLHPWQPAPHNGTPPWRSEYETVAKLVRGACGQNLSIERLEGDIHVAGRPETIMLYRVSSGVVPGKRPFLVIDVHAQRSIRQSGKGRRTPAGVRESGIAHGNT